MAESHWSANRMLAQRIEEGIEAEKRKQKEFSNWRSASVPQLTMQKPSVLAINWAA